MRERIEAWDWETRERTRGEVYWQGKDIVFRDSLITEGGDIEERLRTFYLSDIDQG